MKSFASLGIAAKIGVVATTTVVSCSTAYLIWRTTVTGTFRNVKEVATNTEFAIKIEEKNDGLYGLGYKENSDEEKTAEENNATDETEKYTTSEEVINKIAEKLEEDGISAKSVYLDKKSKYIQKFINAEIVTNYPNVSYKYEGTGYNFEVDLKELNNILKSYGIKYDKKDSQFKYLLESEDKKVNVTEGDSDTVIVKWTYKEKSYNIIFKFADSGCCITEFKQNGIDILPRQIAKKYMQGTVNIIRRDANAAEEDLGKYLEYIPYGTDSTEGTFAYMLKNNNPDIMHYFSINEENWDIYIATYTKINGGAPTFTAQTVSYKNLVSKYSVKIEFLVALMQLSGNQVWAANIAEMVTQNSKIDFVIQDCLSVETKTVQKEYYETKYNEENELDGIEKTGTSTQTTVTETNTIKAYIREADTWIVNVTQNYVKTENDSTTSNTESDNNGDTSIVTTTTINTKTISYNASMITTTENVDNTNSDEIAQTIENQEEIENTDTTSNGSRIIVLDPGHGKSSLLMSNEEKTAEGYVQNGSKWGEWRHWKNGQYGVECNDAGCAKSGSSCWYGIEYGDRDTEPTLTLNNALAAKKYLEQMGYTVRMTRTSNEENPSFTKRASYCFKNGDISAAPDAELYVCIHSNAGGGNGTAYITAEGEYKQKYINSNFASESNRAGELINNKVAEATGLKKNSPIGNMGYLIAFNKNPVPTAYLEIGFYDNASDLAILETKSDDIGKAIAEGINEYLQSVEPSTNLNTDSNTSAKKTSSIVNSNENKFLGTWKNKTGEFVPYYNDDGTINLGALYDPKGEEVEYKSKSATHSCPADGIIQNSGLLFELLQSSQRTQQEEQLMRYLLHVYTGSDYGVTEFDFSVFDASAFSSRRRGSRIVYDSLTFTDEDLEILYKITSAERGGGTQEQQEYVVSVILNRVLSSGFPDTVRGVVFAKNQFQPTRNGKYEAAIPNETTKAAVHSVIENGDTSQCALYFMTPAAAQEQSWLSSPNIKYLFNDNNDAAVSHNFYTNITLLEELKVFMKGGGGNGDIIESCENVIEMMLQRDGHYSLSFGTNGLTANNIKKVYEQDSRICCATYVAMVLYDSGLFTEDEINSYGYNGVYGISEMLSDAGWTKVSVSEAEEGDIALWKGNGANGHVYIYAGDDLVYDQICCVTSSRGAPPTTKAWSGWAGYSAKTEEVWRAP